MIRRIVNPRNSANPMNPINQKVDLIIKNASELLTLSSAFREESGLGMIRNGALAVKNGKILWVGKTEELSQSILLKKRGKRIDAAAIGSLVPLMIKRGLPIKDTDLHALDIIACAFVGICPWH